MSRSLSVVNTERARKVRVERHVLTGAAMLTRGVSDPTPRRGDSSNAMVRARASGRAFTLIELMTVVVIVGILATLATYGVRKYVLEAKKAEASSMLVQIRAAEEAYKAETFEYLGLDDFDTWNPTNDPTPGKRSWSASGNAMGVVFNSLGVSPDGGVIYSYAVVAGGATDDLPTLPTMTRSFSFPEPAGPFYIAMAKADLNGDGKYTYAICHSSSGDIYIDDTL